jgi:hypothetical protein
MREVGRVTETFGDFIYLFWRCFAEKFGASMAIVKSDVGGNIAVFFSPDPLYMEYGVGTQM